MLSSPSNAKGGTTSSSEVGKLVFFLLAIVATVVVLSLSSTNDFEDEHNVVVQTASSIDAEKLLETVPSEGTKERRQFCAKVANVGEWVYGEKAVCERVKVNKVFAHTVGACAFEKDSSIYRRQKKTTFGVFGGGRFGRRRDAKAWVPHEGLMDACQFFRFASATTPAQALGSSEKSGGGDGETTSLVIDTDVTATPDAVAEATRKEEEVEEDENALNDFAIQRMMRGRDALFVGDSQIRHVYAAFLRIAAIGDVHEAHLHPPKRPKLKNSLFNRKYRVYVKSARKTNRNVADEVEEQNIETEVVGDVPGDKHAKTDPLKHRNWTFAIQGGGVAHFVWAPEAKDVVEVVKERLLLDSDGESTKDSKFASPDFLVAGVGLWHMLHQADPNDFQRQVAEVKALLDDIDFKTTVPFWLTVSKPGPSHLMNSVKKQFHLTADSWDLYRQATEKEFSDDASQTLAIDFGALTEKCGAKCSVDGVHVDETAYDAAAQILLNALASLWDVKIPKFRVSSKKGDDASEDSEYEPLDFKEPKDINPVARTREDDDERGEKEDE